MTIDIENDYGDITIPHYERVIQDAIESAILYVKCPYECEVNVLLTSDDEVHSINKEQRNIDSATDVLSFPMIEYEEPAQFTEEMESYEYMNPETEELMLGDIVISMDKVYQQAEAYNHSNTRELAFLVAHSMLHLFGYDHMDDDERRQMEHIQEEILKMKGYTREYEEV